MSDLKHLIIQFHLCFPLSLKPNILLFISSLAVTLHDDMFRSYHWTNFSLFGCPHKTRVSYRKREILVYGALKELHKIFRWLYTIIVIWAITSADGNQIITKVFGKLEYLKYYYPRDYVVYSKWKNRTTHTYKQNSVVYPIRCIAPGVFELLFQA